MKISKGSLKAPPAPNCRQGFLLLFSASAIALYYLVFHKSFDIYAQIPFCDADGTCHEKPDTPSPRTPYSAKSAKQYKVWWELHAKLNATAQSYAERRREMTEYKAPMILLGDSITESWIGTNMGFTVERAKGIPEVMQNLLSSGPLSSMDPLILAIAGDQTQHLLYRLQNGQLLPSYAEDPHAIFVVLIGTNNIGSGGLPGPVAQGVLAVAGYILTNTKGKLLLLQSLPRGDGFRLPRLCPPRCKKDGKPFDSFLPAIAKLNKAVEEGVLGLNGDQNSHRLKLLDCGYSFIADTPSGVNELLMPDKLHPNAAGHEILGECIAKHVEMLNAGQQN